MSGSTANYKSLALSVVKKRERCVAGRFIKSHVI